MKQYILLFTDDYYAYIAVIDDYTKTDIKVPIANYNDFVKNMIEI